MIVPVDKQLRE